MKTVKKTPAADKKTPAADKKTPAADKNSSQVMVKKVLKYFVYTFCLFNFFSYSFLTFYNVRETDS